MRAIRNEEYRMNWRELQTQRRLREAKKQIEASRREIRRLHEKARNTFPASNLSKAAANLIIDQTIHAISLATDSWKKELINLERFAAARASFSYAGHDPVTDTDLFVVTLPQSRY